MPTVKDLKILAKERGLRRYHNMKKAELLTLLEKPIPAPRTKRRDFFERPIPAPRNLPIPAPRTKRKDFSEKPIPAPRNIMNIRNPSINIPILQPDIAVVKENQAPTFIEKTAETVLGWMNWLVESGKKYIVKPISSSLKNLKEKINKIFEKKEFEVKEGESTLKNFVREYIIDGKLGYDPQRFFEAVRNLVLKILKENKNTKVKMILNCKMQRTDLSTGEIIEVDAEFHSEIETNLKGKDENKLFDKIIARIGEVDLIWFL